MDQKQMDPGSLLLTNQELRDYSGTALDGFELTDTILVQQENAWVKHILFEHWRLLLLEGGRAGGKSWGLTRSLLRLMDWGSNSRFGHPPRIGFFRETFTAIPQSVPINFGNQIKNLGMASRFKKPTAAGIEHLNGANLFYAGLGDLTAHNVKSMEDMDIAVFDEAQFMTAKAWEILKPTIRKPGSQIILSYNPNTLHDPVWKLRENMERGWKLIPVSWRNNRFLSEESLHDIAWEKKHNAARFNHIWEGIPDDGASELRVLPFALGRKCVEAWDLRPPDRGQAEAGLDPAGKGVDYYGFALRRGPCLLETDKKYFASQGEAVQFFHAHLSAHELPIRSLRYDEVGVGAGVHSEYHRLGTRKYLVLPENGGEAPQGGGTFYSPSTRNRDFFMNRKAQMPWTIRLRAENTVRLMEGDKTIDHYKCLFINPNLPLLEETLKQLSQPIVVHEDGKMRLFKKAEVREDGTIKKDALPSPDIADAVFLAFGSDSEHGLSL